MRRCWTEWHPVLPVLTCALFGITLMMLVLTCCCDPGVIPRRSIIQASASAGELSEILGYEILGVGEPTGRDQDDLSKMVPGPLREKGYKWCRTCKIVRPPRASHCPDCDQCVLRFDHHCPFVNNCVGQRNYHFFVGFVSSVAILALLVVPSLIWAVLSVPPQVDGNTQSNGATFETVLIIVISGVVGITAVTVLGFLAYHMYLIANGQTTKEHWRKARTADLELEPTLWGARGQRLFDPRKFIEV